MRPEVEYLSVHSLREVKADGYSGFQMDTENAKTSIRVDKQLFSATSEYQRIDVFESSEFGK